MAGPCCFRPLPFDRDLEWSSMFVPVFFNHDCTNIGKNSFGLSVVVL